MDLADHSCFINGGDRLQGKTESQQNQIKFWVFGKRGKLEYPRKNLSGQSSESTSSTHVWRRGRNLTLLYVLLIFLFSFSAFRNPKSLILIGQSRAFKRFGFSHPYPEYGPLRNFQLNQLFKLFVTAFKVS